MPATAKIRVLIASDHAAFRLKNEIKAALPAYDWQDLGTLDEVKVDYPDFAELLGNKIAVGEALFGILLCGSGTGMCIAANKVKGVRAAQVENPTAARLAREHNDANVLCLGARFLASEYAVELTRVWLETPFSNDPRHVRRIEKINALEMRRRQAPK